MYREECEPVRRGRKLRMAVAGWRSRRSRPSVTPDPSRSARVRPASIEQGTPIMAWSSSPIPDGDRGDGIALTAAPVCTARRVRRSLHRRPIRIMSMTNALVGADRMAALPSRAYPRTSGNPGFTAPKWRSVERGGWERLETNSLAAWFYRPHLIHRRCGGSFLAPCQLCPPDLTSADRRPCDAPLDVAWRNVLRPVRRECRPGNLPGPPALSPGTSGRGPLRQGTVSMSVCLNSSAVARMGTL